MNTYFVGVDHGYRNMKTSSNCFPSAISEIAEMPDDFQDVLEFENKYYTINSKNILAVDNHDKSKSKEFYLLTLVSIAKEIQKRNIPSQGVIIRLASGLPQKWYLPQKKAFKEMLSQNNKLKFTFEGIDYDLILSVGNIYMQGYMACFNQLIKYKNDYCVIVDIGGETMDIIPVKKGRIETDNCHIDTHAMIWLYKDIADSIRSECYSEINDTFIERYISTGSKDKETTNKYEKIIQKNLMKYSDMVFEILKEYKFNMDITPFIFVGGGEQVVRNFGEYDSYEIDFVDDICSNAKGYENAEKALSKNK